MTEQTYRQLLESPNRAIPEGFKEVTREEFERTVHPMDVAVSTRDGYCNWWELPNRTIVGWSWPGWKQSGLPGLKRVYAVPAKR